MKAPLHSFFGILSKIERTTSILRAPFYITTMETSMLGRRWSFGMLLLYHQSIYFGSRLSSLGWRLLLVEFKRIINQLFQVIQLHILFTFNLNSRSSVVTIMLTSSLLDFSTRTSQIFTRSSGWAEVHRRRWFCPFRASFFQSRAGVCYGTTL